MIANLPNSTLYDQLSTVAETEALSIVRQHLVDCRSRELRDVLKFATDEIILPMDGGPYQGQPFNSSTQPYVPLLYHEMRNGAWSEIIVTGPSQSGKTLCSFVIPVVYVAAELNKNVVVGVPDEKMVNDKWSVDIEPVFRASPSLAKLLPTTGPGSKGGVVKEFVKLRNGVAIKFMTRGGSDQSKAGFTASHVIVTEAAGWSEGTETSKEADPLRQLRARQRATSRFDDEGNVSGDRLMVVEGTVTDEYDLPWRAKQGTTESVIVCPCVHCGEHVTPEREHLVGWSAAESELQAAKAGYFVCPKCGGEIDESARERMNQAAQLLHRGQTIDADGNITGSCPETSILWFRWNAFNNLFLKISDLSADEWKAAQIEEGTPDKDNAEKELCQQVWAIPWSAPLVDAAPLRRTEVRRRRANLPSGVVPNDVQYLSVGIDVGKWVCWYFGLAARADGTLHCPFYGQRDTGLAAKRGKSIVHEQIAIRNCLLSLFDEIDRGYGMERGGMRVGDIVVVDAGYNPDAVYDAVRKHGQENRYFPALGRGKSQLESQRYAAPNRTTQVIRKIGDRWHMDYVRAKGLFRMVFDADDSKMSIQACLRVKLGSPGALSLAQGSDQDHILVARHLASEVFRRWLEPGKGIKEEWTKKGANHLLDCAGMAYVGLKYAGWKLPEGVASEMPDSSGDEEPPAAGPAPARKKPARGATWLDARHKELKHAGE